MTPKKRGATPNGAGPGSLLADRYRLEERVAGGGMGEVWRATDMLLQRIVAVKLLRESLAEDPIVAERFRREALLAAQLSHPNMAGVFDYVQNNGRPGIVMEFVDGETLAERLGREERLSVADSVRIASGLLSALQSAHGAGIVHRDVKPGNVMLTAAGDVKVTDFGIARAASDHTLTETGMVIGTAHYLAPEQVSGEPATPSSDLYAVGAILYETLAGQRPFEAETPIAVAMKRLAEEPPPVRSLRPDVPEPVANVIERSMSRAPSERYASAEAMREALESSFAAALPATAPQKVAPTPTEVLPVAEAAAAAATTAAVRPPAASGPPPVPKTGEAPASAVGERRKREYKRLVAFVVLLAVGLAAITFVVLAFTGSGNTIVTIPPFKGMTFDQASTEAAKLGLKVTRLDRDSALPAGSVIAQDIRVGTRVISGDARITLIVSTGTPPAPPGVPMPDVRGQTQEDAERVLIDVGFTVQVTTTETDQAAPGTVIDQNPAPDTPAQSGQQVDIVVAATPKKHRGNGNGGGEG
jgi:serine/threonine-protein kinase